MGIPRVGATRYLGETTLSPHLFDLLFYYIGWGQFLQDGETGCRQTYFVSRFSTMEGQEFPKNRSRYPGRDMRHPRFWSISQDK